jgi:nucleoside-diphosphate-sugar epimerase
MNEHTAIIGAGGFVGASLVEALALRNESSVRAIVRSYRSVAPYARFGPTVRTERADAENAADLARALRGCSVAINLTTGPPTSIERSTRAIYQACLDANVGRLIHLSSAVVFGDSISELTDDDSPPLDDHWMPYARAKGAAERWIRDNATDARCRVIVLRPGIVWGVRSPHTLSIARSLAQKTAYLVDGGAGVFNAIYIDNLIGCLLACRDHPEAAAGFFNVADPRAVTWWELYAALAPHLGADVERIPSVSGKRFPWSVGAALEYVQLLSFVNPLYHRLKRGMPDGLKARLKGMLHSVDGFELHAKDYPARPRVTRELWHLQRTTGRLTTAKFDRHFQYQPSVTFEEGVRRTVQWLTFLGYVRGETKPDLPHRQPVGPLPRVAA